MFTLKSIIKLHETVKTQSSMHESNLPAPEESKISSTWSHHQQYASSDHEQLQGLQRGSRFLTISVVEARHLVAKDYDTHSSDPFVKITLGSTSKKTRAISRNCHPMWEQRLVFPLEGLVDAEPLLVELFDKDFNGKEFLGQVMMTLGKALEIEGDSAQRSGYWFVLSRKRSADVVGGELCLGFEVSVLDAQQHVQLSAELEAQLTNDQLVAQYSSKALRVHLKGINGLAASGLFAAGWQPQQQQLSLFIKYGRVTVEKPLQPHLQAPQLQSDPGCSESVSAEGYEVAVNEEVIIPLAAAVRATPLVARRKDELYDVKVYLKSQDTVIAKTQIPIAAVPHNGNRTGPAQLQAGAAGAYVSGKPVLASAQEGQTAADGSGSLPARSGPSTPRPTASDQARGTCSPVTPRVQAAAVSTASSSPDVCTLTLVNRHLGALGGWAGGSGSLSTASSGLVRGDLTSSASGFTPSSCLNSQARMLVEGSLGSVTACNRDLVTQAPAGLHGRRVQGLAELHESNVLRKPLKSMFVAPREASYANWVVSSASHDDTCEGGPQSTEVWQGRLFCRTMESTVPMYCDLEVSLALSVLEQGLQLGSQDSLASTHATGKNAQDVCDEGVSGDEQHPTTDPTHPIQLGPALELPLQDVTLSGITVHKLFTLVSPDSALMKAHNAAHDVTDVVTGPWRNSAAGSAWLRVRDVSYTKKLNIPLPLAPEKCRVWEEHRLVTKGTGGWVLDIICKNDAPKGDCFEAQVQMCGVYVSSCCTRLRISMQLNWIKNTWGKGMVQSGAETDAKRAYSDLIAMLQQHTASTATGSTTSSTGAGRMCTQEAIAGAQETGNKRRKQISSNLLAGMWVWVSMAASVLVLAWAVLLAGHSITSELRALREVVKECSTFSSARLFPSVTSTM